MKSQPRGNVDVTKVVLKASLAADPFGVAFSLFLFANVLFLLDGCAVTSWMVVTDLAAGREIWQA